MTAKEWLINESYPEIMTMTRSNLEDILIRFAELKCKEQREICAKEYEKEKSKILFGSKIPPIAQLILNAQTPEL